VVCKPPRNSKGPFVKFRFRSLLYAWCFESTDLNAVSWLCVLDNTRGLTLGGLENPPCSATMPYKWD
jgi:hypothetical protein